MKKSILIIAGLIMVVASLTFTACNEEAKKENPTEQSETGNEKAYYECPMKCEGSKSDKPGSCPVCGMDLEKIDAADSTMHEHQDH